jgi:hypothetical protein
MAEDVLGDFVAQAAKRSKSTTATEPAQAQAPPPPAQAPAQASASVPPAEVEAKTERPPTLLQAAIAGVERNEDFVAFTIGGRKYQVPPIYFYTSKRHWEDMGKASGADPIARIESILTVISAAIKNDPNQADTSGDQIKPGPSFEHLCMRLKTSEWLSLSASWMCLLVLSGFLTEEQMHDNIAPAPEEGAQVGEADGAAQNAEPLASLKPSSNGGVAPTSEGLRTATERDPTSMH